MKRIILTIQLFIIGTLFVSCGGGSGDTTFSGNVIDKVVIINCDNSNQSVGLNDCASNNGGTDNFTCVKDDDVITSINNNTQLLIVHRSDGSRKVCVQNGNLLESAYISREL